MLVQKVNPAIVLIFELIQYIPIKYKDWQNLSLLLLCAQEGFV
jgi:hypothetical protein